MLKARARGSPGGPDALPSMLVLRRMGTVAAPCGGSGAPPSSLWSLHGHPITVTTSAATGIQRMQQRFVNIGPIGQSYGLEATW